MAWWKKDAFQEGQVAEWQELATPEGLPYFFNTKTNATTWERPDCLKSQEELLGGGNTWVWAPHDEHCFVPAQITGERDGTIHLVSRDGQQLTLRSGTHTERLQLSSLARIVPDLVLLDTMNNPLILHNLRSRFERDEIYTNVGTILISINPFKNIANMYTPAKIASYQNFIGAAEPPPHVYKIAADSLKGVLDFGLNQSIIISGESGAGKTEATKQCLCYMAAVASGSASGMEQKILLSNPILEAFGNAKTIRNDNSSRFGKYIEILLDNGQLCGGRITSFLLEKVRVVQQAMNERNFHIFFQLAANPSADFRRKFLIGDVRSYRLLNQSGCISVPTINDASDMAETLEAMSMLGFSSAEQDSIVSLVSSVMHIGNIEFAGTGDRSSDVVPAGAGRVDPLDSAAKLMQIAPATLQKALTWTVLRIQGQQNTEISLSAMEADDTRDVLAKFLFGALFNWIVQKINKAIVPPAGKERSRHIGILDIFGFEIFENNSFEQLCINYTNEKLQQHFNAQTFKLEEAVYIQEGIRFDKIAYIDNQPVLDLIEQRPTGILNILNEELIVPRGSDMGFYSKISGAHSKSAIFQKPLRAQTTFIVHHYAGAVMYESTGFMEKNKDTLSEDLLELLSRSSMPFMAELFPNIGQKVASRERKASLAAQFTKQLDTLMATLNSTEPHYIRCIKPNNDRAANRFLAPNVLEQLRYSGVFEAVAIRKSGFPFRQTHANFVKRYKVVNPLVNYPETQTGCSQIIDFMKLNVANTQMGKSMVLYRAEEFKKLELQRSINVERQQLIETLERLIKQDPNEFKDPESYFQQLSKTVKRTNMLALQSPVIERARKMLSDFIEARIDPTVRDALVVARQSRDIPALKALLDTCEEQEYGTALVKQCRALYDRIARIIVESELALRVLDERAMAVCIKAAAEVIYKSDTLDQSHKLLYQTPKQTFFKEQMKCAVSMRDNARAIRITVRLKDMFLSNNEHMFMLPSFAKLKTPAEWAAEKFFCMDRDKLASSMLVWSDDPIHSCLQDFEHAGMPEPAAQALDAECQKVYKCVLSFFESTDGAGIFDLADLAQSVVNSATSKKAATAFELATQIVHTAITNPKIRDEIYFYIMKLLTRNPRPSSSARGWDLMAICLSSFAPNPEAENYVEVFLRQNAQPRDKFVGALNKIIFEGTRPALPSVEEVTAAAANLVHRSRGFSEPLPPAAPSYLDLTVEFKDVDPSDVEFHKPAPRPAAGSVSVQKPATSWISAVDPASGGTYYYNEKTGESQWEMPDELRFRHHRSGSRIS